MINRGTIKDRFTQEIVRGLEVRWKYTWGVNAKSCYYEVHLSSPWLPWDHVDFKEAEGTSSVVETTLERALRQLLINQNTAKINPVCFALKVINGLIAKCRQSDKCFSECE